MTKDEAIKWAGSVGALAERLGISSSAVSQWGPVVPELQQYRLARLSAGKLAVDGELETGELAPAANSTANSTAKETP